MAESLTALAAVAPLGCPSFHMGWPLIGRDVLRIYCVPMFDGGLESAEDYERSDEGAREDNVTRESHAM